MKLFILITAILASSYCYAAQVINVVDGAAVHANIAAYAPTRLVIQGGRIKSYTGAKGELTFNPSEQNGQLFIQPEPAYVRTPINLFVVDDSGNTYTLLLTPQNIPSTSIVLVRKDQNLKKSVKWEESQPYKVSIRDLIVDMAENTPLPDGFEVSKKRVSIKLWKEAQIELIDVYHGATMTGRKYILRNIDTKQFTFDEHELYSPGTLAVAIEKHRLEPGEYTYFYIVSDGNK